MAAIIHLLWLVLMLSLCLEDVNSQSFPYVSFRGQTLANHSYVDLSEVGYDTSGSDSDTVQCITDLGRCCTNSQSSHRGDWYFPEGTRLGFSDDIFVYRRDQTVYLRRRNNPTSPVGIYRCDIPTNAVHDVTESSVRDTVYVGLYTGSGGMFSANHA